MATKKKITIDTEFLSTLLNFAAIAIDRHTDTAGRVPGVLRTLRRLHQAASYSEITFVNLSPYEAAWLKKQVSLGSSMRPDLRQVSQESIGRLNIAIEQSGAVLPPVPDDDTQPVAALDSDSEPGDDTPDYFGDPSPERPGDPLLIEDADEPAVYLLVKAGEYDDHPTVLHAFASRKEAHSTAATLNTFSSESFEIQEIPFTPAD